MALSGSFYKYPVNPSYGSFGLYCEWSGEQSISGNYTNVTLTVYIRYYNLSVGAKDNCTVSINGVSETYTSPAINNYPAKDVYHWIKTYTVKVPHNSDGTKTCKLSASWPFNGTYAGTSVGTITASATVTLDPIARLSEPTCATSAKMGSSVTIKTNRKSTALKHVLKYTFGTQTTETQIATGVGESYPWTVPDLAAKCNNALSGTCTIYCHTYSGSTYLGTKTTKLTLTVPDATTPTVSAATVKMGGSVTLSVSGRKSTNFKHKFTYTFGSKKDIVIKEGVTSSCTWPVPDLAKECNNATSGTCTIKCYTYNGTKQVGTAVSKTITLQVPDPSVPTLSASTVAMGSTLAIYTNSKSGNFTHDIAYSFNGATGSIVSGIYTLKNWTVPIDLAATIPSATKGTGTITCTTYNGTAKVDTKPVTFTATVPDNSTTKPTISGLTLTPSHLEEYPNLKQHFSDIYVQGLTKVKAAYTANAPYSSVKSVTMTVKNSSGKSLSSVSGNSPLTTSGAINAVGDVTVTLTVTNARGQTNSSSKKISFYEYSKPELLTYGTKGADSLLRCDENGNISTRGLHLRIHAGREKWSLLNGKNYCDLKYRWKVYDGLPLKDEEWITLLDKSDTVSEFDGVATVDGNPSSAKVELAANKSYLVEIRVVDTVGNYSTFTKVVLTCEVTFLLKNEGKGASFGKYPEADDLLDVAWNGRFMKDLQVLGNLTAGHIGGIGTYDGKDFDELVYNTGYYVSASAPEAVGCSNFPINKTGILDVISNMYQDQDTLEWCGFAYQTYRTYDGEFYTRSYYSGQEPQWSKWIKHSGVAVV